jgi:hypothetical protein
MVVGVALGWSAVIIFLADIKLAADDRLDARLLRLVNKLHRAIDVAVVGHGHSFLPDFGYPFHQALHAASAVKQGIIGMEVKVNELRHGSLTFIIAARNAVFGCVSLWITRHFSATPQSRVKIAAWDFSG